MHCGEPVGQATATVIIIIIIKMIMPLHSMTIIVGLNFIYKILLMHYSFERWWLDR